MATDTRNQSLTDTDTALHPLNDAFKFFIAHLPFKARSQDIREHFSQFGSVNFVKLVSDKSGKSKGFGFLYMSTHDGDAAVQEYARKNNNRITILDKSGVFLKRNDQGRQHPIRNPKKKSHYDEGISTIPLNNAPAYSQYSQQQAGGYPPVSGGSYNYGNPAMMAAYNNPPPESFNPYAPNHLQSIPQQQPAFQTSTKVLLENLPLSATPDDLSLCLNKYSLNVVRCTIEYDNDPKASWCYAHIDLYNSEESGRCVALAQQQLLEYRGRILTASFDPNFEFSLLNQQPQQVAAVPILNHQQQQPLPPPVYNNNHPGYQEGPWPPPQQNVTAMASPGRRNPTTNNGRATFRHGRGGGGFRGQQRQRRRDRPY